MSLLSVRGIFISLILGLFAMSSHAASSGGEASPYFGFAKPFVVNLSDPNHLTYLQVNVQLKLKDPLMSAEINKQLPALENALVLLLSDQTPSSIKSVQGKQDLRKAALKSVQEVCQKLIGKPVVEDVYFTGFIIQ